MGNPTLSVRALAGVSGFALVLGFLLWLPSTSAAEPSCSYSVASKTLTVRSKSDLYTVRRFGEEIRVFDIFNPKIPCIGAPPSGPTVTNTDQIRLVHARGGGAGGDVSLAGGPFAPGASGESDGHPEIEFRFVQRGTGPRSLSLLEVLGGPGPEVLAWSADGGLNLNAGDGGDLDVDITVGGGRWFGLPLGVLLAEPLGGDDQVVPAARSVLTGVFSEGGKGDDLLRSSGRGGIMDGWGGDDTIIGGKDHESISGGPGADRILAGAGWNFLGGGPGRDRIRGGGGRDAIGAADGFADKIVCGRGPDRVRADQFDTVRGCERVDRVVRRKQSQASLARLTVRPSNTRIHHLRVYRRWLAGAGNRQETD